MDGQGAADGGHTLAHVGEPGSHSSSRLGVAAYAVVDDLEAQLGLLAGQAHLGVCFRAGVFADVLQPFETAELDGGLDLGRKAADLVGD